MCGILLSIGLSHNTALNEYRDVVELLSRRGPDGTHSKTTTLPRLSEENCLGSTSTISLTFVASVLALRGDILVAQPLEDRSTGSQLCWNGEAWKASGDIVQGNDTVQVQRGLIDAAQLNKSSSTSTSLEVARNSEDRVMQYLASISGPYAFVFYDASNAKVYFGRDPLGRRSLLYKHSPNSFCLSSVGDGSDAWTEVDSNAIYVLHMDDNFANYSDATKQFTNEHTYLTSNKLKIASLPWSAYGRSGTFNRSSPSIHSESLTITSAAVATLEELLVRSVALRVDKSRYSASAVPETDENATRHRPQDLAMSSTPKNLPSARYAVLFSGGLDCSVLCRMLHDQLPYDAVIDLLNVAFENPRLRKQANGSSTNLYDLCPDRVTAKKAHQELCVAFPERKWRLIEIDVPYDQYKHHRNVIVSLMHPHDTEMDLSIAMALYFAARGEGVAICSPTDPKSAYTSCARVLFSGLGADELFGGYQRHATAFSREGYGALLDALELDITRLGKRNLGRDDRVIAHWGKEVRYPYLDEEFVKWAMEAPVWNKCGFGQHPYAPDGLISIEPGKQGLRLVALKLGLPGVAFEKKRAIQFGARTAKMEGRSKGTEAISKTSNEDEQ